MNGSHIYLVTNNLNGKQYVGQTVTHDNCVGHGKMVKQAYKKYGKQNFEYQVVRSNVPDPNTLNYLEKFWIGVMGCRIPNGYNIEHGGRRSGKIADETRAALSAKSKGNKYRLGIPHPESTIQAMREARKNMPADRRKKISEANKGRSVSEETRRKIADGNRGKVIGESTRAKLAAHNTGKTVSEETRMKLSTAAKRQWAKVKGAA